jgi:hypothetical protein
VAISERDRRIWAAQVEGLNQHELHVGHEPTGEDRRASLAWINDMRRAHGMPPLCNDEDEHPEIGFYRLAVARGMVK